MADSHYIFSELGYEHFCSWCRYPFNGYIENEKTILNLLYVIKNIFGKLKNIEVDS